VGEPGRPAAAKTGTAEGYSASDFAGYVPQMAAAVWVGNPHRPNSSLAFNTIGGRHYGGSVFGATIGGPIWRDTLRAALVGVPVEPLPEPDRQFVFGQTTRVPDVTGLAAFDARSVLRQAGFQVVTSGRYVASLLPAGTVAFTEPRAGSSAPQGATVVLRISNGLPPPTPAPSSPPPSPSSHPTNPPSPTSSPSPKPTKTRGRGH
jgi:membrane peptidoglycan carboxypeptidase